MSIVKFPLKQVRVQYIQVNMTSRLPSLDVYFWYHHQNFYKTFSDNNILKEEPYFCAWTRSPQKCLRSEYSKKNKNPNKKRKKSTTNQLPKKTMQRIFTPYRNQCSLQEMDEKETAGILWFIWKAFKRQQKKLGNCFEAAREKRLILVLLSVSFSPLSLTALSSQLQEWNAAHLNKNLPFCGAHIKSN